MKFKKIIAIGLIVATCCISGCRTEVNDSQAGDHFGNYVIISETHYTDPVGNSPCEYLVYDQRTKVMYTYTRTIYGLNICPYYVINDVGEPVVGIFNERLN